jgi:isopenicillin N synthase-like dioxygenase
VAGAIPVVDYGPLFAGVPESVIERAFAAARRCHALPLDDKLKLRLNENNIGYLPLDASVQGASRVH